MTFHYFQAELGTDLLSQLSVQEQREVDRLNDKIQELTREAKEAYKYVTRYPVFYFCALFILAKAHYFLQFLKTMHTDITRMLQSFNTFIVFAYALVLFDACLWQTL